MDDSRGTIPPALLRQAAQRGITIQPQRPHGALFGVPLRLRLPLPDDAADFVLACNDEMIRAGTELPVPYDYSHAQEFVEVKVPRDLDHGSAVAFSIVDGGDHALGVVSVFDIRMEGTAQVGFWVAPDARGQGVATAAVSAVTRWAFDVLALRRLTWRAVVGNLPSLATACAAGFTPEGTARLGLRHRENVVDCWTAAVVAGDKLGTAIDGPRAAMRVEIAAGAWQLQPPATQDDAKAAEALLPVSACLPTGMWLVRHATTAQVHACVGVLTADGRAWVVAGVANGGDGDAGQTGVAAATRYCRDALGLAPA